MTIVEWNARMNTVARSLPRPFRMEQGEGLDEIVVCWNEEDDGKIDRSTLPFLRDPKNRIAFVIKIHYPKRKAGDE